MSGATTVEPVDLPDLISFAQNFDLAGPWALNQIANFAGIVMTGVGINPFLTRVETIRNNRHRTPPTVAESVAVSFLAEPTFLGVIDLCSASLSSRTAAFTARKFFAVALQR